MNTSLKYTVQIINDAEQLTEALKLRYKTYKKVYPKLTEQLTQPYESDAFDSRSIHLGLYCENGSQKRLAGYCRLILPIFFESTFSNLFVKHHAKYLKKIQNSVYKKIVLIERLTYTNYINNKFLT